MEVGLSVDVCVFLNDVVQKISLKETAWVFSMIYIRKWRKSYYFWQRERDEKRNTYTGENIRVKRKIKM